MADIAELVLAVNSKDFERATKVLDDFKREAGQAEREADKLTSTSEKLATAFKAVAAAFGAWKLVDFIKDSAMLASRFETLGVVMKVAGNNAGYSSAELAKLEKQLQKTGISMMESRNILTQLATANVNLADATKLARAAQDLAVVGNTNSSDALARMVHGIKSSQVEILRTMGLQVQWDEGYQKLATTLNKTVGALTEQEKMQARVNLVLEKSSSYAGIYEESMSTAGKAMGSLTRYWEDLKIKMGEAFLPTLAEGVFAFTDALKAANAAADEFRALGQLTSVSEDIRSAFVIVAQAVIVLAANVAYTARAIVLEVMTIVEQAKALALVLSGQWEEWARFKQLRQDAVREAEASRAAIDAFSESVLNWGKSSKEAAGASGAVAGASNEQARMMAGAAAKTAEAESAAVQHASALLLEADAIGRTAIQIRMIEAAAAAASAPTAELAMAIMIAAKAWADATVAAGAAKTSRSAGVAKTDEAYKNLLQSQREYLSELDRELDGQHELTKAEEGLVKLYADLDRHKGALAQNGKVLTASQREEIVNSFKLAQAKEQEVAARKASFDAVVREHEAIIASKAAVTGETEQIRARTKALLDRAASVGQTDLQRLNQALDANALEEYMAVVDHALTGLDEYLTKAGELRAERAAIITEFTTSEKNEADQLIKGFNQQAEALGKNAHELGLLEASRYRATAASYEHQAATLRETNASSDLIPGLQELARKYNEVADARESLAKSQLGEENRQKSIAAANELERALTDSLFRAAESGKSFFESLRDSIKGMFNNLVLKPIVSAVMKPAAATITGMFGGTAAAAGGPAAAGNFDASMLSQGFSLAGLSGAFGTGLGASFGSMASAGIGGWASAAGSLMGTGTAAGAAAGLGMVAAPIAAAYLLYSLLSSGGEKRAGSTYGYSASDLQYGQGLNGIWSDEVAGMIAGGSTRFIGGPSGGEIGGETVRASVAATVAGINGLFERLGSTDKIDQFWGKLEQSEKGRGGVFAGGRLASGASFGEAAWESGTSRTLTAEEAIAAFALDLQQATIQALQSATDIPASVQDVLRDVDAESLTQDQVAGLLQTVEAIVQVTQALSMLGVQADSVTTAMLQAAGGAESLQTAAAAYYQGYYSEAERVGRVSELLAGQFADLGLEMPGTRDEFRALVESLDLTSASGQAAYGTLLPLSEAFGVVADWSSRAAEEAARAAEEMARATEETARAAEMARLDAQAQATGAEIDALVAQFGDLAGAMRELEAPAETLVDAWRRTASELQSLEQGLAAALGGTQMSSLDQLRATTAGIAGLGMAIADLDAQMLAVRVGRGDAGAVSALRAEEARLMQDLAVSGDPAATAAALARVTLQRIDLEARRRADADAEALSAAQEIAALEGESRAAQIDALRDQISAAERLRGISESLVSLSADLRSGSLSALDPFGRQDAMAAEYQRVLGMARAGDVDAAGAFGSLARDYLSSGQSLYGGATAQYADLFRTVLQDVDALGASLDRPGDVAAQQLEALLAIDAQQEQARQITLDTSGQQLDALAGIREALIGRQDEMRAQQQQQTQAVEQQIEALRRLVEGQEAEIRQRAEAMAQLNARLDELIVLQSEVAGAARMEAAAA